MDKAIIVGGLGFGDEGKGAVTDYMVRRHHAKLVVRYNGGPQAAHNVVTADGRRHTFSQFGAGTFAGARTFLSRHMLVDPLALLVEARVLASKGVENPLRRITIDPECVVVTHYHRLANRAREEARGDARHGSVGLGVGEARGDELDGVAVRFGDLCADPARGIEEMTAIAERKRAEFPDRAELQVDPASVVLYLRAQLQNHVVTLFESWLGAANGVDTVVFEGAQGILLDEDLGFAPHNTWTRCTFANAQQLVDQLGGAPDVESVGVIRTYHTRHGAGPFPTEAKLYAPESVNKTETYMGPFRVGHFDASALDYAVLHGNPDSIALTHCDCRPSEQVGVYGTIPVADTDFMRRAEPQYCQVVNLKNLIEQRTNRPVCWQSFGPTAEDVRPDELPSQAARA